MIDIHGVGYQFLLLVSVEVAKDNIVRVPGAGVVQDVFCPRIVETGAKLVPTKSPFFIEELTHDDFFVPVTVDIEGGYSDDPAAAGDLAKRLIDAGVVGINIEDGAGTPERNQYHFKKNEASPAIAPHAFLARLPQRLVSRYERYRADDR